MNSKKIYVNARFLTQQTTGVQRFAAEISKQLASLYQNIEFISPPQIINHDIAKVLNVKIVGKHSGHRWEQLELPKFLKNQNNPVLLNLANTAPYFYSNSFVVIHDLAVYDFPQSYSIGFKTFYKILLPKIAKNAIKLFTVSDFSRSRIKEILHQDSLIIKNGVDDKFSFNPSVKKEKFILAVSSQDPKKNFSRLIEAFCLSGIRDYELKVIGSQNRNFRKSDFPVKAENINFAGYVSDEELKVLYSKATAFVYPSLYEGFGIPPLEAMASGCPTLVSDIPSLKEVCGDASIYFNPLDTNEIARKIEKVCYYPETQTYLIEKGLQNVNKFSWKSSAEKLLKSVLEAVG